MPARTTEGLMVVVCSDTGACLSTRGPLSDTTLYAGLATGLVVA